MKKMHIKFNILLLIAFLSISVKAQEVLTVSEAIELALENNYGIKIASNNNRIAENNTSVLNSGYLPTLTGNAGATYNIDNILMLAGCIYLYTKSASYISNLSTFY